MTSSFIPLADLNRPAAFVTGLGGFGGSGKTYSMLRLATAIARETDDGWIAIIETEPGQIEDYRDAAAYPEIATDRIRVHPMEPTPLPGSDRTTFNPRDFRRLLAEAQRDACVVAVDSWSDEWIGVNDIADDYLDRNAKNWKEREQKGMYARKLAKENHTPLLAELERVRVPVFLCMRAKLKTPIGKDDQGKMEIGEATVEIDTDMQRMPYKCRMLLMMDADRPGYYEHRRPVKRHLQGVFPPGGMIDDAAIERFVDVVYRRNKGPAQAPAAGPRAASPANGHPEWAQKYMHLTTADEINAAIEDDMLETDKRALHYVATRMRGLTPDKATGTYLDTSEEDESGEDGWTSD